MGTRAQGQAGLHNTRALATWGCNTGKALSPRKLPRPPVILFFNRSLILVAEASFLQLTLLPHLEGGGDFNLGAHAATPVPAMVSECDSVCPQGEIMSRKGSTLCR